MNLGDRLEISSEVEAREVGGDTMLLDLVSGAYFRLDAVGGLVWRALEDGASLAEACDRIEASYEVARDQLEHAVLTLVHQLSEQGLVSTD